MSRLTPSFIRRGIGIFLLTSLAGWVGTVVYGRSATAWLEGVGRLRWGWVLAGLAVGSLDWFGGGLRLWIVTRLVHPSPPLGPLVIAGGMGAWGAIVTPANSGSAPLMVVAMRRAGVPLGAAAAAVLMTFVATVAFFAIAGPLTLLLRGGTALRANYAGLGLSLYDLWVGSAVLFGLLGVLFALIIVFPAHVQERLHALARWAGSRHPRVEARLAGVERALADLARSVAVFRTPRGLLALWWATCASALCFAPKLVGGYFAMRAVGVEAPFVDVLILQTLITFLLYFAPTPGASGIGEVLAALIMAAHVPKPLTPLYTLVWRLVTSWGTLAAGVVVFSAWLRQGLRQVSDEPEAAEAPT
ncbi:MAG: lysylphosphatidylglycerol synthase transmembrane domain-containing protein [Gemmatimonadales bacterium]|nr:lysylphosphatidylglycerol synthase transmembrane domain-containing protein [Gemmatimonadales bacterium]